MNQTQLEAVARAVHETNRAFCIAIGDTSQVSWDDAPQWQKTSALNGVRGILAGDTPEDSHVTWMKEKLNSGWKWGKDKDAEYKTHPCIIPYDELPQEQKAKDRLFVSVALSMIDAFN